MRLVSVMGFTEEEVSSTEDFNVYRIRQCCCSRKCFKTEIKREPDDFFCPSCDGKQGTKSREDPDYEDVEAAPCDPVKEQR